ncbi:MAG: sigma-70 family RNA polymerase sigma factor [Microthrixaceae bacterium]|nr:sigma-70 family RNA polymerase sigma factor [Microthrixaceae bacterium]
MDPQRTRLVESNLGLVDQIVVRVASRFPSFIDRSELIAAGKLGLVEASIRYDFNRSVPFPAFASQRIRGAILDVARATDWAPRKLRQLERYVDNVSQELANVHGGSPTDDQFAARIGVTIDEIKEMRRVVGSGVVRHLSEWNDDCENPCDVEDTDSLRPDEVIELMDMKGYVRAALESLPERLRIVVVGVYLEERPQEEIARLLGISSSRVSQLRSNALEMIRQGIESQFTPPQLVHPVGRAEARRAHYAAAIAKHSDLSERLKCSDTAQGWSDFALTA